MKPASIIAATTRPCNMLPFEEAVEHIALAGYRDIALFRHQKADVVSWDTPPARVRQVRDVAEQAGIRIRMLLGRLPLGSPENDDEAVRNYCRLLDNAAALGAEWVLDCGCAEQQRDRYVRCMRRAAGHAGTLGLKITLKPHGGVGMTGRELLAVVRSVGSEAFTLCYDPGNILYYSRGKHRPEEDVLDVAAETSTCIIKDCAFGPDGTPTVLVTPGSGEVSFPRVLGSLAGAGYDGPFFVECVGATTFPEIDADLAFTRGYVRGILEGLTPS